MKGESKKRKEKKIGRKRERIKKKNPTTLKHDTEQMSSRGTDKYLKLPLSVFKTQRQKKKSAIKQR